MSETVTARLYRGNIASDYADLPRPVIGGGPGGPEVGRVLRVWFDGEYTVGEMEIYDEPMPRLAD